MSGTTIQVAIVENVVLDISAFKAHCLRCGWDCHRQPHETEATAVKHAKGHICADLKDES